MLVHHTDIFSFIQFEMLVAQDEHPQIGTLARHDDRCLGCSRRRRHCEALQGPLR